MHRSFYFKQ